MDEHEGVLRVISQPNLWSSGYLPPSVQSFRVNSSEEVLTLGKLEVDPFVRTTEGAG